MIRKAASYLGKYPSLKRTVKFFYQSVAFGLSYHRTRFFCKFRVRRISDSIGGFFGYYDKSPESPNGRYVVYHVPVHSVKKVNYDEVEIVLFDKINGTRKTVDTSKASNLQSGTRLHWLDDKSFIFNSYDEGSDEYVSKTYFVDEQKLIQSGPAIYDTNNGKFITVNYKNLAECNSEYGYFVHKGTGNKHCGVWFGSIGHDNPELVVALDDMKRNYPRAFLNATGHHFNHLMFSPSGDSFIAIFRWSGEQGRNEVLFHFDLVNRSIRILNDEMTSHCCWADDSKVICFMSNNGVKGYYSIYIGEEKVEMFKINDHVSDGHPTFKNGLLLIDTYPDYRRMQHIFLIDKGIKLEIGSFFAPLNYHEKRRCDLHPRFNFLGNRVYFDSMHSGKRHLYVINFGKDDSD